MSKELTHWAGILNQYKESGLSQKEFCKANNLSWNKFRYQWHRSPLSKGTKHVFEPVTLLRVSDKAPKEINLTEIAIYLPNQIRFDVKIDLHANAF